MLPDNDIKVAFAALPRGFREAVYYADIEGYTYAETASILGVPLGTAMSRASRGRQRCASPSLTSSPRRPTNRASPETNNQLRRNDRCRRSMTPHGRTR